jgi:Protein of unknown function (DUF3606)
MLDIERTPWRIDMRDEASVVRWAHTYGVTRERLRHAVFKVGTLLDQLRVFLMTERQVA